MKYQTSPFYTRSKFNVSHLIREVVRNSSAMLEARKVMLSRLRRDLIGPGWIDKSATADLFETLDLKGSTPLRKYLFGYLEPGGADQVQSESLPELGFSGNDIGEGHISSLVTSEQSESSEGDLLLAPSSMGLTIKSTSPHVNIKVTYGEYTTDGEGLWHRSHQEFVINHKAENGLHDLLNVGGKNIRINIRTIEETDGFRITTRLVNDRDIPLQPSGKFIKFGKALATIYQPTLCLSSDEGQFQEVRAKLIDDPQMFVLYRNSTVLAVGHNVGVDWDEEKEEIRTDHLPSYIVPKMFPNHDLNEYIPSMSILSSLDTLDEGLIQLERLVKKYDSWVSMCEESLRSDFLTEENKAITQEIDSQIQSGRTAVSRISAGIETLRSNELARVAFTHSNRSIQISQESPEVTKLKPGEFKWRPFQIIFQLMNINGLTAFNKEDPFFEERDILDLAWFPTGGGKTEAYLGLIAYLGFYRRLRDPMAETLPSVHVIMRYTLRLLTMDQGERLVRLMGGMNSVANESIHLTIKNGQSFRVGMWIGKKSSPNRLQSSIDKSDAKSILNSVKTGAQRHNSRVIMFESCPWCGDKTLSNASQWSIGKLNDLPSLIGRCPQQHCPFSDEKGIPFTCVDEDIYNNPPSVLLGTVDKFVQTAYNRTYDHSDIGDDSKRDVRRLLGFTTDNSVRPPDLVIQDELHLLTGPLGSMAGLMETAIETAWNVSQNHKPKYVAATATIRGASRDAKLMFGRDLSIFPPPINTANDNFFAREIRTRLEEGRMHVAVLGPPEKARTIGDLPTASLLQSGEFLRANYQDSVADPFWTVIAYFNSLRELGGLQSSLTSRISSEWIPEYSKNTPSRSIQHIGELTSRVTQTKLVETKKALEISLTNSQLTPLDLVATSNMFQVGIDISRLGLMVVNGQPRSNSEYIQSSGRVGRSHPGLVVSLLRSTFPRDQSHYETHRSFHQELYRHVDHTSTTPFSLRALDRALDTTVIALLRMGIPELAENDSLNTLTTGDRRRVRRPIQNLIKEFSDKIQGRLEQTQFKATNDQKYIKNVVDHLDLSVRKLQSWVEDHYSEAICCWFEPYRKTGGKFVWWANQNMSDKGGESLAISSLRDVADEIPIDLSYGSLNKGKPDYAKLKIPAGHIISHASPGSLWEMDGMSYMTGGLSQWQNRVTLPTPPLSLSVDSGGCLIKERQIDSQFGLLGGYVNRLRTPPTEKEAHGFVRATIFPRSFTCSKGHMTKGVCVDEQWSCGHENCSEQAQQNRFVSICPDGHLHEFDYSWWTHKEAKMRCTSKSPTIRLDKLQGHAYDLGRWVLTCESCNATATMKNVPFASSEDKFGVKCGKYGEPWLSNNWDEQKCDNYLEHRQVGAASVTYNNTSSVLLIPVAISWDLANHEVMANFLGQEMTKETMLGLYKAQKEFGATRKIDELLKNTMFDMGDLGLDMEAFFEHLSQYDSSNTQEPLDHRTIRKKEHRGLRLGNSHKLDQRFSCTKIELDTFGHDSHPNEEWPISSLSRVDRLTELRYITGISRIKDHNPQLPIDDDDSTPENFGLANFNFGEGIFFEINHSWLMARAKDRILSRKELASMPHSFDWDRSTGGQLRQLPCLEIAENRNPFTILHSLSHLLMKQLCQMSGYSLGSIRERLYLDADAGDVTSAGILIYTSGPSSDGTLGGLCGQANQKRINLLIEQSLESRLNCSNDPICSEHQPLKQEPNGAACHTCLILPETSCELRNHMLDREWGG
jgi:hypothetical protein